MSRYLLTLIFLNAILCFGQITGQVLDETNQPIANARVRIQFHSAFVETDASGNFVLDDMAAVPFDLTAAAHGYYNGFTSVQSVPDGTPYQIHLQGISLSQEPLATLNPPESCQGCHASIFNDWNNSPMKKTGLNTWVFDLYDGTGTPGGDQGFVYQRDSIHRQTSPNSDCSACHSPVHWLADIENNGMGRLNNINADMENGVQCEVCHRAYDVDINQTYEPGVQPHSFQLLKNFDLLEFGALGDATFEGGIMRGAYNPQLTDQLCSACHEDNVDHDGDGEFNDPGSLPHETTFTEYQAWKALSPDNTSTCASCHMPAMDDPNFCIFVEGRQPGAARSHDIRGTTPEFLENALELEIDSFLAENLTVDINLANSLTGHAVPTGVVVRNVILLVEARDSNGNPLTLIEGDLVDEVGGVGDPAVGNYAFLPGQAFYRNMANGDDERLFYTEAQRIESDTRIQPGDSYQGRFVFQPPSSGAIALDVRVIYRRAFRDFVLTKGWTETGHGEPLADVQAPHYGHLMERIEMNQDPCLYRDLDGSNVITNEDLRLMAPSWKKDQPDIPSNDIIDIRQFVKAVNCK